MSVRGYKSNPKAFWEDWEKYKKEWGYNDDQMSLYAFGMWVDADTMERKIYDPFKEEWK